jgi:hypothetical protein
MYAASVDVGKDNRGFQLSHFLLVGFGRPIQRDDTLGNEELIPQVFDDALHLFSPQIPYRDLKIDAPRY